MGHMQLGSGGREHGRDGGTVPDGGPGILAGMGEGINHSPPPNLAQVVSINFYWNTVPPTVAAGKRTSSLCT